MAVAIRLKLFGKKKEAVYRVVVADQRKPRDGKVLEEIGFYNPKRKSENRVDEDRVKYWLSVGAQPTKVTRSFLAEKGLIEAVKYMSSQQKVKKKDRKKSDSDD